MSVELPAVSGEQFNDQKQRLVRGRQHRKTFVSYRQTSAAMMQMALLVSVAPYLIKIQFEAKFPDLYAW